VLGCCRRTVRRWGQAFLDDGLIGFLGRLVDAGSRRGPTTESAIVSDRPVTDDRLVPVVPISVPELRRIRAFRWFNDRVSPAFFWQWSIWRRYKQALAMRSHYQKRGASPPDFAYVRL
jgi:hypothetical protein